MKTFLTLSLFGVLALPISEALAAGLPDLIVDDISCRIAWEDEHGVITDEARTNWGLIEKEGVITATENYRGGGSGMEPSRYQEEGGHVGYRCLIQIKNTGADIPPSSTGIRFFVGTSMGGSNLMLNMTQGFPSGSVLEEEYFVNIPPRHVDGNSVLLLAIPNYYSDFLTTPRQIYLGKFFDGARQHYGFGSIADNLIEEAQYDNNVGEYAIVLPSIPLPSQPQRVRVAEFEPGKLRIEWGRVSNADYYKLFIVFGEGEGPETTSRSFTVRSSSFVLDAFNPRKPVKVDVYGVNAYGAGPFSDRVTYFHQNDVFTDVHANDWFRNYVLELYYNSVVEGYKDAQGNPLHLYGPADSVTVAEVAAIFTRSVGAVIPDSRDLVPAEYQGHWAAPLINWLVENDYYLVHADKNPDRPATREDVLRFGLEFFYSLKGMREYLATPHADQLMSYTFPDINTDSKIYIQIGYDFGIVDGFSDGTFRPSEFITRAAMAKILRLMRGTELRLSN